MVTHGLKLTKSLVQLLKKSNYIIYPLLIIPIFFQAIARLSMKSVPKKKSQALLFFPVGGGGLLAGIITGLKRHGWHDVTIYAVETEATNSFHLAQKYQQPIDIGPVTTHAVTLGARLVSADALSLAMTHPVKSKLVSEKAMLNAIIHFAETHRMLVEPACGASLALLHNDSEVQKEPSVMVIVCGGVGVSLDMIHAWRTRTNIIKKNVSHE